jgi:hypothetical protein
MSSAMLITANHEFFLAYPGATKLATSFYDALVAEAPEYMSEYDPCMITSAYPKHGLFIIHDLVVPEFVEEALSVVQQLGTPVEGAKDRSMQGIVAIKGSDFKKPLNIIGSVLRSQSLQLFPVANINTNTYDKTRDDGKVAGNPHADFNVTRASILLGSNPGGIEMTSGVVDEETFESLSDQGLTLKVDYGQGDVAFFEGQGTTHRGYGVSGMPQRQTLVGWVREEITINKH